MSICKVQSVIYFGGQDRRMALQSCVSRVLMLTQAVSAGPEGGDPRDEFGAHTCLSASSIADNRVPQL